MNFHSIALIFTFSLISLTQLDAAHLSAFWADRSQHAIFKHSDGKTERMHHAKDLNPSALLFDETSQTLYWTDPRKHSILRMQIGSAPEVLVSDAGYPYNLALSSDGTHLYWSDPLSATISHLNLKSGEQRALITRKKHVIRAPRGLAVTAKHLYWVDSHFGTLQRSRLDGRELETLLFDLDKPWDIAVSADDTRIFWSSAASHSIHHLDTNSGKHQELTRSRLPLDIEWDENRRKLFWISQKPAGIYGRSTHLPTPQPPQAFTLY